MSQKIFESINLVGDKKLLLSVFYHEQLIHATLVRDESFSTGRSIIANIQRFTTMNSILPICEEQCVILIFDQSSFIFGVR